MDFWSYSYKASGNLSFNPHSYSELSHLLGPQSSVEVERVEMGFLRALGLQAV